MTFTPEAVYGALGAAVVVGGLIWKAATKLSSIESKVDKALEWIGEQKAAVTQPRQKKASRR